MGEWLGLGPSAASQLGGRRFQRPANLSSWAEAVVTGEGRETEAVELDHNLLLTDAVIFGLRLNQGINLFALSQRFYGATNAPAIESLLLRFRAEGLVTKEAGTYRATHRGRLVCDAMGSALIEESDCPRVPA
jgi:oxygen-independent coproporphyrinogen-3 oxidase